MNTAFAAVLLGAAGALATVVERLGLPELVQRAAVIAEGRVESATGFVSARGVVCTRVVLEVERNYRGSEGGKRFTFVIAGGEAGNRGLLIPGMPRFEAGERAIVFLTAESTSGVRAPVGLAQGKFRIATDAKTGEKRPSRELGGLELRARSGAVDAKNPQETLDRLDFATLAAAIERQVREDDARRAGAASRPAPGGAGK